MRDENTIVRERQLAIRREIDRRGISLKAVAFDSGLPYSTVLSYFPGEKDKEPHTISGAAIHALCRGEAIPGDLLSMILPEGFMIVRAPVDVDHDQVSEAMREYLSAKDHAHHPASPAGRDIAPCEEKSLGEHLAIVKAVA